MTARARVLLAAASGAGLAAAGCPAHPAPPAPPAPPLAASSPLALPPAVPGGLAPLARAAPLAPLPDGSLLCEAEDFTVRSPGWQARPYGENYYAATFANTFLSRRAFLGAPEQAAGTEAALEITVPRAGTYLALVRYEAAYRFETRFTLRVEQGGTTRLERGYGARENKKIWAFGTGLAAEKAWDWGATENIVWEGHDAPVSLEQGPATLTLLAGPQPGPAARRNVDLVLLSPSAADIAARIQSEAYLPLDGLLTQAGDLYARAEALPGGGAMTLTLPPGTEHSPYWVHRRSWAPRVITLAPGESSPFVEVGSLLDTLSGGQWPVTASPQQPGDAVRYRLDFAAPDGHGQLAPLRSFEGTAGELTLAYDADTRTTRRVRRASEGLVDLVERLGREPLRGRAPERTLIYGLSWNPLPSAEPRYEQARRALPDLLGATALLDDQGVPLAPGPPGLARGYVDLRDRPIAELARACEALAKRAGPERVRVVSLGDEINLALPDSGDDAGYRAFLGRRKIPAADAARPGRGEGARPRYRSPGADARASDPRGFYYSSLYRFAFGAEALRARTEVVRRHLPDAEVGANFSPHASGYLGEAHKWVTLFREGALTMPWSEDYAFQQPIGTQQMNSLGLDLFRAGVRHRPGARLQYYVMAHDPGNNPASWRRLFYADIAHGMNVVNLFEIRSAEGAYTENHVDDPRMYAAVRVGLHELGLFEDLVQDGAVRPARVGLWFSETADVWQDAAAPFGAAKRTLYIALRHAGLALDVLVEQDALDGTLAGYDALYLADRHLSREASRAIAAWVARGGTLVTTAGAAMRDELDQPNAAMGALFGVEEQALSSPAAAAVRFEKQDLPFSEALGEVSTPGGPMPVFGARGRVSAPGARVLARFENGEPAVTERAAGKGRARHLALLPGLSYFRPALPMRPMDRNSREDSMAHFLPTAFDLRARDLVAEPASGVARFVSTSSPLVEATVIEAARGVLVPLINWSPAPIAGLTVRLAAGARSASLASGGEVKSRQENGEQVYELDLAVADALILR